MTLDELRNYIKSVSLAHKDIQDFYMGNDYNQAEQIDHTYPMVFYELPYLVRYNLSRQVDEVQFAYNVFVDSNWDKIEEDHDAISKAKEIGDAIVTYIVENTSSFIISSVNAVSVREFGDDSVAGMRYEWVIGLPRTFCSSISFEELFDPLN